MTLGPRAAKRLRHEDLRTLHEECVDILMLAVTTERGTPEMIRHLTYQERVLREERLARTFVRERDMRNP